MPDLFAYFLTGVQRAEFSIASTSQLLDPVTHDWNTPLLDELGIPARLLPPVIKTGETYGLLTDEICEELGCPKVPVIAVATKSPTYDKTVSNLMECRARGASVIAVATEGDEDIKKIADHVIYVPRCRDAFSAITASVPLQLLAREVALLRGCDVDQPRNLAKSVTVE